MDALAQDGFATYLTTVGGPGLGILQGKARASDSVVPGAGERSHVPAQSIFRDVVAADLGDWAMRTGSWVHA